MPFENYTMGYKADVPRQRYHDLRAGLLDYNEVAVLYQDMIEANFLPSALLQYAIHFVEIGLCRVPDQMPYH